MADLRVMVIADDSLSRAGLAALLGAQPGLVLAGQIASSAELSASLDVYRPEAVLWDLGWDPSATVARLAELREAAGPLVLATAVLLPGTEQAAEAWRLGARILLLREVSAERLAAALLAGAQGLAVLDPAFANLVASARDGPSPPPVETLTPREIDVLRLMAEGLPNKAIARGLGISEHTVKFHVNAILGKLGVESRTEAVVRATRLGLILL